MQIYFLTTLEPHEAHGLSVLEPFRFPLGDVPSLGFGEGPPWRNLSDSLLAGSELNAIRLMERAWINISLRPTTVLTTWVTVDGEGVDSTRMITSNGIDCISDRSSGKG